MIHGNYYKDAKLTFDKPYIDKIQKIGGSLSMETQASKEQHQVLVFEIEF